MKNVGLYLIVQHMVRVRWEELIAEERSQMTVMAYDLLHECARANDPWVLKSQTAALMAEVGSSMLVKYYNAFIMRWEASCLQSFLRGSSCSWWGWDSGGRVVPPSLCSFKKV